MFAVTPDERFTKGECSICLDNKSNKQGDEALARLNPCNHIFHVKCMMELRDSRTPSCPECRVSIKSATFLAQDGEKVSKIDALKSNLKKHFYNIRN